MISVIIIIMDLRKTRQKKIIAEALKELKGKHPSIEQIYASARGKDPQLGVATVYRNINSLCGQGSVKRLEGLGDTVHYDDNPAPHYHFICTECGKVIDIPADICPKRMLKLAEKAAGCRIKSHDIVFRGICADCEKEGKK